MSGAACSAGTCLSPRRGDLRFVIRAGVAPSGAKTLAPLARLASYQLFLRHRAYLSVFHFWLCSELAAPAVKDFTLIYLNSIWSIDIAKRQ